MSVGRPLRFKNHEELEEHIQDYFDNLPVYTMIVSGEEKKVPVATITGLALHLGFATRQSLYDYEKVEEFSYTIKKARLRIENDYEMQLRCSHSPTGAIFGLKNLGWRDQKDIGFDQDQPLRTNMVVEFTDVDEDQNTK